MLEVDDKRKQIERLSDHERRFPTFTSSCLADCGAVVNPDDHTESERVSATNARGTQP
jgi:hypothetical protein